MRLAEVVRKSVVMEQFEVRQMLAFTPTGNAVPVGQGQLLEFDGISANDLGQYVAFGTTGAGQNRNVFFRTFSGAGVPISNVIAVSADNVSSQADAVIDINGKVTVTWSSDSDGNGPGTSAVYVQRFSKFGSPLDLQPVLASAQTTRNAVDPHIAQSSDLKYVVVWQYDNANDLNADPRIYQQLFNADGTLNGAETLGSNNAVATQPDVQINASGTYVVVWNSTTATLAQQFTMAGGLSGATVTVASITDTQPSVGVAGDGSFVVAYETIDTLDITRKDVSARRFSSGGAPIGNAFITSSDAEGNEQNPQIVVANTGKFAVAWAESAGGGQFNEIGFRAYSAGGAALTDDTQITGAVFGPDRRFGITWPDTVNLRLGYESVNGGVTAEFTGELAITLDDTAHVIQFFGSENNIRVVTDGVTTDYAIDLFTNINLTTGLLGDYIRLKNIVLSIVINSGDGNDTVIGGAGNDSIDAGAGDDVVQGGDGQDTIVGGTDQDTLFGGNGNDNIADRGGRNLVYGEEGDDVVVITSTRPATILGGNGNDALTGGSGGDAIYGNDGDDTLDGGLGNDNFFGGNGNDLINGNGVTFPTRFDLDNDTLRGDDGFDQLNGNSGNDKLVGGNGFDDYDGGDGTDYAYLDADDSTFGLINVEVARNVL